MTYVSTKQLGDVISVATLDNGDVVSTPAEIDNARALVFFQNEDNGAVCTLSPPDTVATPKLIHLTNRGAFPVTVQGVTLQPGPTYGIWWDGSAYSNVAVEGVGVVSNTANTDGASITGDGSPIDPLTVDIKVSTDANNGLQVRANGLYVQNIQAAPNRLVVVDGVSGSDTYPGSLAAPFKTIAKAIATVVNFGLILVVAGSYTEVINLPAGKNFLLEGLGGAIDSNVVTVTGNIRNTSGAAGIRLKNLTINSPAGQGPALLLTDANGSMIFDNVSFNTVDDQSETIHFTGDNAAWYVFNDGSIKGGIKVEGVNTGASISLVHCAERPAIHLDDATTTLAVSYQSYIGAVTHLNGNLFFKSVASIASINSSANAPNLLAAHDSSMFNVDTGAWNTITKTGTAFYTLDLKRDPTNNSFTGTPLFGVNAADIHGNYVPAAYTPTSASLVGHLEGIDDALAATGGGLSAVTSTDSATVDFSGAGTAGSPLTAVVKRSSTAGNVLTEDATGLYVAAGDVGLESVSHSNSDTIDITGDGTPSDPLLATVAISPAAHNLLTSDINGLVAIEPTPYFEVVTNVSYMWLADEIVFEYKSAREFTLPQDLTGSQFEVIYLDDPDSIDPENPDPLMFDATITIAKKNNLGVSTTIGTIVFAVGQAIDVNFATAQQFTVGEAVVLTVDNEARFRNFTMTLLAQRPYTN